MSDFKEREQKRKTVISTLASEQSTETKVNKKLENRVQKAYYLDKEIFKALRMKSMQEETTLTEAINNALKIGLKKYIE